MKALVMDEDTWMEVSGALNDWPEGLALIAAKVHPVDIPEGCVLAVVDMEDDLKRPMRPMLFTHREPVSADGVYSHEFTAVDGYRRVIQEVKP